MYIKHTQKEFVKILKFNQVNIMTYRKIPLIHVPYIPPLNTPSPQMCNLINVANITPPTHIYSHLTLLD